MVGSEVVVLIFFAYLLVCAGLSGYWIGFTKGRFGK